MDLYIIILFKKSTVILNLLISLKIIVCLLIFRSTLYNLECHKYFYIYLLYENKLLR